MMADNATIMVSSVRGLAKLLNGEPAHTTVGAWLRRPDWPFNVRPPWPLSLVPDIDEWRDDTLDPDRNTEQLERKQQAELLPCPGSFRVTLENLLDPTYPMRAARAMPQALVDKLTTGELTDLANHLTYAFALAFQRFLQKTGEGDGLPSRATGAYWLRVGDAALNDPEIAETWVQETSAIAWGWASRRFKSKADRAALTAHWDALPETPNTKASK